MALSTLQRLPGYVSLARNAFRLKKSDEEQVRAQVRNHLITRMGKMRGLPQKLGQMLSFTSSGDEVSSQQYAVLQEQADPLPLETVVPIIEAAWGRPIDEVLLTIEPSAHAASLGQVHRATTRQGQEVAVKVQYPGIRKAVMADLKMLGWLSRPAGGLQRGFDLAAYRQTILNDLEQELDYRQEAANQQAIAQWTESEPGVYVPQVVESLSSDQVLVSEWQEGDHWDFVRKEWRPEEKRELAVELLRFFLRGLLIHGQMQADWHPGNFRFRRTTGKAQWLLYDFGSIFHPTEVQRLSLARLVCATQEQSESPWPLFMRLGFQPEFLEPLAAKLPSLCRILFEPFCCEYPYDINDWQLGERVADILGDDRWNFRIAGPANLVFLMRAFHGLKYYLHELGTPISWSRPWKKVVDELTPEIDQLQLTYGEQPECSFGTLARYLKIRVREYDRTKVELTQYASNIDHLDELLDDQTKQKIHAQGYDLQEIITNVRRAGYAPMEVFRLEEQEKQVVVWLE